MSLDASGAGQALMDSVKDVGTYWPIAVGMGAITWAESMVKPMLPGGGSYGAYVAIQSLANGVFESWRFMYFDRWNTGNTA